MRQPRQRHFPAPAGHAEIDSRPGKAYGVDATVLHQEWGERLAGLGVSRRRLQRDTLDLAVPIGADDFEVRRAVSDAVAALEAKQSTWRPAEITRELAAALPPVALPAGELVELLDRLTVEVIREYCVDLSGPVPDGAVLRRDGRPVTETATDRALTTPGILAQEAALLDWADRRTAQPAVANQAAIGRPKMELSVPQAETAAAVAGSAGLVLVVGPAGTGKTTALAPAVVQLATEGRRVFGVAPSAAAAEVLACETGIEADTLDKLLAEHHRVTGPRPRYQLPAGTTVLVDEAAMAPTENLARLAALADAQRWRVVLVGDPMQFSAVGRGGMFGLLVDTVGAIELDRVHRFTHPWEAEASLRLRRGDPGVAQLYDQHGRLHGGTPTQVREDAVAAWWDARQHAQSVVLSAPTNDTVTLLNRAAQACRITAGEIDTRGRHVEAGGYRFHVGDEVVTRRNDRDVHTDRRVMIRNRDHWHVTAAHRGGDLSVEGPSGRVRLPAAYVQHHLELGYAQTSHASQGRTVDRSILVLDSPCDVRGLYVPMTRGRHSNDAYIAIDGEQTPPEVFAETITRSWIDQPAHTRAAQLTTPTPAPRPGILEPHQLRALFDERASIADTLTRLAKDDYQLPLQYHWAQDDLAQAQRRFQHAVEGLQTNFDLLERHDRPMHRRGHHTDIARAKENIETLRTQIPDLDRDVTAKRARVAVLAQRSEEHYDEALTRPRLTAKQNQITRLLDDDALARSRTNRHRPPDHVIHAIGNPPASREASRLWDLTAGHINQHHTAYSTTTTATPGRRHNLQHLDHSIRNLERALHSPPERPCHLDGPSLRISM